MSVIDFDFVRTSAAQFPGAAGDDHLGAKFLGLSISAPGQVLSGYSRREAQIIFDLRTGAGLSSGRGGFDHEHVEAFGRGVHGRGQSRRTRADNDHIANQSFVNLRIQAQAVRHLLIAGILEHGFAAANQDRNFGNAHVELIEHLLHAVIFIEIEIGIGMPVASEKFFDTQSAGTMRRPDEHHVARVLGDQLQTAHDKCGHQDLAEIHIGLHQLLHGFAIKLDYFAGLAHARTDQGTPPGEHVHLAGELSGVMLHNGELALIGGLHDVEAAADDHKKRNVGIALINQRGVFFYFALAAYSGDAFHLGVRELWKKLLAAFRRQR